MRPKTLILFIVALGCGLVASIGVSKFKEKAMRTGPAGETSKIYVAATEIRPDERLDATNVSLEEWPKDRVPEGAVTDLKELEEKFSRSRLIEGEPILLAKLSDTVNTVETADTGNADASSAIPPGFRVVAVKVDENSSGGGLIRSGDRVDVVLFLRKSQDIPETITRTIVCDVNVLAMGEKVEREDDQQGSSREVRRVSLLVTPKQAECVRLAMELGVLSLSLRRPGDDSGAAGSGETVRSLLGSDGEIANEKSGRGTQARAEPWLANTTPGPGEPRVAIEPSPPPAFTMTIRTNNGVRTFLFEKLFGPPQDAESPSTAAPLRTARMQPGAARGSNPPVFPADPPPNDQLAPDQLPVKSAVDEVQLDILTQENGR